MVDKIKPLKMEDATSGVEFNLTPTESDPAEDYVAAKGVAIENLDAYLINRSGSNIAFTDPTAGTRTVNQLRTASQNSFDGSAASPPFIATDVNAGIIEARSGILSLFGSGSDGNVSLSSGTTTLTRDMYYNNLTLSSTAILKPGGYVICVRGTLTISGTAVIQNDGAAGGNATTNTAGTVGAASPGIRYGVGQSGTVGANVAADSVSVAASNGYGGSGGNGGGGGGNLTPLATGGVVTYYPEQSLRTDHFLLLGATIYKGAGGGGAGGNGGAQPLFATAGAGGAGGSGGGVVMIFCSVINSTSSVGVTAKGGNGGNGGNASGGNGGGGGSGGGGGGGMVYIVASNITAIGTVTVTGGATGTAGTGTGSGAAGTQGTAGSAGHTAIANLGAGTWTTS